MPYVTANQIPLLEPNDVSAAILYALGTPPHVQVIITSCIRG